MSKPETTTLTATEMHKLREDLCRVYEASMRVIVALGNDEEPDPDDVDLVENNDVISPVHMVYEWDWVSRFPEGKDDPE
jgi:hypothetical protein